MIQVNQSNMSETAAKSYFGKDKRKLTEAVFQVENVESKHTLVNCVIVAFDDEETKVEDFSTTE